jgi:drug/metabolite transporter (DMT)-like permease
MHFLLNSWICLGVLSGFSLGVYMVSVKAGGSALPPSVFAMFMYLTSFLAIIPFFLNHMQGKQWSSLFTLPGIPVMFACLAGLGVMFTNFGAAAMFSKGAPLGIGMMIVQLVSLGLAILAGWIFFNERMNMINLAGLALGFIAVALLTYSANAPGTP